MASEEVRYRISPPTKKGLRSVFYGLAVLAGAVLGGVLGLIAVGSAALYSAARSVNDLYKSTKEKYREKRSSYIGRSLSYAARTIGTITVPWLQGLVSLFSGGATIAKNGFYGYHFPEIYPFEERLKEEKETKEEMRKKEEG